MEPAQPPIRPKSNGSISPPSGRIMVKATLGFAIKRLTVSSHALTRPICWRFSHGKPVAAAGAPATASGATAGGGADVAPTNSLNGRHSAIPDCQPKSVARNCPVVRPWRICSSVNSPSFAPSRATWIIGMGWFYEEGEEKSRYGMRDIRYLASRITHHASRVERAPEIPGGHRTVRAPFLADLRELFRRRQFSPAK